MSAIKSKFRILAIMLAILVCGHYTSRAESPAESSAAASGSAVAPSTASGSSVASLTTSPAPRHIQTLFAGYNLYTLRPSAASPFSLNGFALGYTVDFRLSSVWPVYLGTGLDARFTFRNKTFHDSPTYDKLTAKTHTTFINLNLPVNISYAVGLGPHTRLAPQLGLDMRLQLYGHTNVNLTSPPQPNHGRSAGYTSGNYDLFSRSDMDNEVMHRFQLGWHAGLKISHGNFVAGISYGTDFAKLRNELGSSNLMINLGYVF